MVGESEQRHSWNKFQKDPEAFFREVLGITTLEDYQRAIFRDIVDHDRIAISACHDVGKSWFVARVVVWYVVCFPYCKVITTAPTFNQVKNILWSEIRAAYSRAKSPLGGKINLTEWQVTKEGDWFALGFTPRNELSAEAGQGTQSSFQGFHAPYVLVVFDEATGIPHNIWTMAEGILTSSNVKFIAIGNPTSRLAEFFKCFSSAAWRKIKLSCFDSPNLIVNGITNLTELSAEVDAVRSLNDTDAEARLKNYKVARPYLLSLKWVVSAAIKWGMDHPLFVSKVIGEFPQDADGTLISFDWVQAAQLRVYYPVEGDRKTLGVDVARFGSDSTVLTGLHGKKFLVRKQMHKKDTTEIVGTIVHLCVDFGPFEIIVVDGTGVGSGVVDLLREAQREGKINSITDIREVQFGAGVECDGGESCTHKDCNKARFVNLKARMFKLLSDDIRDANGLTLPDEDIYLEELPTILYRFDSKGRMFIESKDDFKKRTGRKSPDDADSLALANFGRYDEMSVGTFITEQVDESLAWAKPFAASLNGSREY